MNITVFAVRRAVAIFLAVLTLGFATLPSNTAYAEDGGKVNTGG